MTRRLNLYSFLFIVVFLFSYSKSFKCTNKFHHVKISRTKLHLQQNSLASYGLGALASLIGVGIAYPFDTLKTRAQIISKDDSNFGILKNFESAVEGGFVQVLLRGLPWVLLGQLLIISVASCSDFLGLLLYAKVFQYFGLTTNPLLLLTLTSSMIGLSTAFATNAIERAKVLLQAQSSKSINTYMEYSKVILKEDGLKNYLSRGLGATMLRQMIPQIFYYLFYGLLMLITSNHAPLLSSYLFCGIACAILGTAIVYPLDFVKTTLQNKVCGIAREAESDSKVLAQVDGLIPTIKNLYRQGGIKIFYRGIIPYILRILINFTTTYVLYDYFMKKYSLFILSKSTL